MLPHLQTGIYKCAATHMLRYEGFPAKIASCKWDIKDLGMDHNSYVDPMVKEFQRFKVNLRVRVCGGACAVLPGLGLTVCVCVCDLYRHSWRACAREAAFRSAPTTRCCRRRAGTWWTSSSTASRACASVRSKAAVS